VIGPHGVHPDLVRVVEREIQITTQDFRVQEGLCTYERHAELAPVVAGGVVCRKEGSYILYYYTGGFSWYLFGPDTRLQHDNAGTLGNGSWGYIVGTYDKDAGPNNQRLNLNGARVAQMSHRQLMDLNSAALAIGRHVSSVADPFNGHIDEFRISHLQRSEWLDRDHLERHEHPGAFAVAGTEDRGQLSRHCRQVPVWSSAS
jgi:hypothetical protein